MQSVNQTFEFPSSVWVDKINKYVLEFSENDNTCFLIDGNFSYGFSYPKTKTRLVLIPIDEFSMARSMITFDHISNISASLEQDITITLPTKDDVVLRFKRQ